MATTYLTLVNNVLNELMNQLTSLHLQTVRCTDICKEVRVGYTIQHSTKVDLYISTKQDTSRT